MNINTLEKENEFLRSLINGVEELIFVKDINLNYSFVNDSYCKFFSKSRDEIIGKSDYELFPELEAEFIRSIDHRIIRTKQPAILEERLSGSKNKFIWASVSKYPIFDADNNVIGIKGFFKDISSLKVKEQELAATAEKYKTLTESVSDVIWEVDEKLVFTYISPSIEQMAGYKPEDIVGRNLFEFIKSDYVEMLKQKQIERAMNFAKTGKAESATYEIEIICKNSLLLWIEIVVNPLFDEHGRLTGYRGVNRNIAKRKQNEAEINKHNNTMMEISDFSTELAYLPYSDIFPYIVNKIRKLFGVKASWITTYDEISSDLIVQYSSLTGDDNKKVMQLLGRRIVGFRTHISQEQYQQIVSEKFRYLTSFHELTFGAVPMLIGKAVEKMLGIGWFIGMALMHRDRLVGTMILVGDETQKPLSKEEVIAFAGITSNALGRKKAEEDIFSLKAIIDSSNDLISMALPDGSLLYLNNAGRAMAGWDEDVFITDKDIKDLHPNWAYQIIRNDGLPNAFKNGYWYGETAILNKNGNEIPVSQLIMAHTSDSGELLRYSTIMRNIAENKMYELRIKESEERYRTLIEQTFEGVSLIDEEGKVIIWNPANEKISGIKKEGAIGKYYWDLMFEMILPERRTPERFEQLKAMIQNALRTGIPAFTGPKEVKTIRADGQILYTNQVIFPIRTEKGYRFGSITHDITERKTAELALQESEYRLRTLSDNMPDGLVYQVVVYPDGKRKFTHISAGVEMIHGVSVEEVLKDASVLYSQAHEDDIARLIQEEERCLKLFLPFNIEIRFNTKSRGMRWSLLRSAPRKTSDGVVIWEGMEIDITERKMFEEKIQQLNSELEEKVEKRTLELKNALEKLQESNYELQILNEQVLEDSTAIMKLNEDLIGSQEKLQNALETKDRFFSIIAHDLKNPFVVLLNNSEMLLNYDSQLKDDAKLKLVKDIRESAKQTYALLENLLKWSRSQMGTMPFNPDEVDLYELSLNTTFILKYQSNHKNINLTLQCEPGTFANCDRDMIETVFRNLVSNAIKFSAPNSEVVVEVAGCPNNSGYYQITVSDSGIGMPVKILRKLFNPAENVTRKGTDNERGTGLGLLLCKEFIERHGGAIWAESVENQGSKFIFTLPKS